MRQKFTAGIAAFLPDDDEAETKAAVLGSWVGYDIRHHPIVVQLQDDPQQLRNRAVLYLAQLAGIRFTGTIIPPSCCALPS